MSSATVSSLTGITDPSQISPQSVYDFSTDAAGSNPSSFPGGTFSGSGQILLVGSGWATWNPQINGKHVLFTGGPYTISFTTPQQGIAVKAEPNVFNYFNVTMQAFDTGHNLLGSFTLLINGYAGAAFLGLLSPTADIASVTLTADPAAGGFAFSDLTYGGQTCLLANFCNTLYNQLDYKGISYGGQYNANNSLVPFEYNLYSHNWNPKYTDFISDWGCNLTDVAMIINYYARQQGKPFRTDPVTLNAWLEHHNGYKVGTRVTDQPSLFPSGYYLKSYVIPEAASYYASQKGVSMSASNNTSLSDNLSHGNPVLLQVTRIGFTSGHWIVLLAATKHNGVDTWEVFDPDPALNATAKQITTFDQTGYNNTGVVVAYKEAVTGNLRIYDDPVQLLLTNSQGLETGFDTTMGTVVTQIPNSSYGDDVLTSETDGAAIQQGDLDVESPGDGTYTLRATGSINGTYSLDVQSTDSQGNPGTSVNISGPQAPGVTDVYFLTYSATPGQPLTVQRQVQIDIKPGSEPAPINLGAQGVVPVAILSTPTFNATTVNWQSVRFGPNSTPAVDKQAQIEDVNGDGLPDVVLHFNNTKTGIKASDTHACLMGQTNAGLAITGCDVITIVPPARG